MVYLVEDKDWGLEMFGRFSRRTRNAAIDALGSLYQAQLTAFLIDQGQEVYSAIRDEREASSAKRLNDLKIFMDENPDLKVDGEFLDENVIAKAVSLFPKEQPQRPWGKPEPVVLPAPLEVLRLRLEADGYVVTDRKLRRSMPLEMGLPEAESELVRLLRQFEFEVPLGHLEEALDNHGRGNWASANGQLRTFLQGLLDSIAVHLDASAEGLQPGENRRTRLAKLGFLSQELYEWTENGKNFVEGFFKRLHPNGSHPGLSDEEDCTYRVHMVLLTATLFIRRLNRWPKT